MINAIPAHCHSTAPQADVNWDRIDLGWGGAGKCTGTLTGDIPEKILSFGEDAQGELYVLTSGSANPGKTDGYVAMSYSVVWW